ncbi:MAG: hypothetical protein VB138_03950 [Burkholderia sp.]
MRGFVLTHNGRVLPETFRFTQEACKGITALWHDNTGHYQSFGYWRRQGYRIQPAWLELTE